MNIKVMPPDVNSSGLDFGVDKNGSIRFGMVGIKNLGEAAVKEILDARAKGGEFKDILDFCKRVSMRVVNKRVIENLIKCGAMDSLKCKRSQLLSILDQIVEIANSYQKDYASGQIDLDYIKNHVKPQDFREIVRYKAPSDGLYLAQVFYKNIH